MSKKDNTAKVQSVDFKDELSKKYLAYALSTIMSRSLPDVRDGLKPVHRRLVYAMLQLKLDPKSGYKKCARIVGDVMGKYHPHGDSAIYESLVRMAQSFASRMPIIEGQGNFGSIDGDAQAAMRYTEARLSDYAMFMLEDIDKNTVDFHSNYDGTEIEPKLLPASLPNILINGTEGIAVGMATTIPPHNVLELCDALLHIIKKPECEVLTLLDYVKGPDLPTGGTLIEDKQALQQIYTKGKGNLRLRAKWERIDLPRGQYYIKVSELPYQLQKRKLIEKLELLLEQKKLPLVDSIQDLSGEHIDIQIYPKSRNADPQLVMESLFKASDLETKVHFNMNVLDQGTIPKVMNLKEILVAFLTHRKEITTRKLEHRRTTINNRLEILEGLVIAYLNLDELIRIIREHDSPKAEIVKRWNLTDRQADAILNMRLRSLRKLEEIELKNEKAELEKELKEITEILQSEAKIWQQIAKHIKKLRKHYQNLAIAQRRTIISAAPEVEEIEPIELIEKAPLTVICSDKGWIKSLKGHQDEINPANIREGEVLAKSIKCYNTDKLYIYTNHGKFYTLNCTDIPGGRGHGDPIKMLFDMQSNEEIIKIDTIKDNSKGILLADREGKGFLVTFADIISHTKNGKRILNSEPGNAKFCLEVDGDMVAIVGENRRLLLFPVQEIPVMKKGKGVKLQKYKEGGVADIKIFNSEKGLRWQNEKGKTHSLEKPAIWQDRRGARGKLALQGLWVD